MRGGGGEQERRRSRGVREGREWPPLHPCPVLPFCPPFLSPPFRSRPPNHSNMSDAVSIVWDQRTGAGPGEMPLVTHEIHNVRGDATNSAAPGHYHKAHSCQVRSKFRQAFPPALLDILPRDECCQDWGCEPDCDPKVKVEKVEKVEEVNIKQEVKEEVVKEEADFDPGADGADAIGVARVAEPVLQSGWLDGLGESAAEDITRSLFSSSPLLPISPLLSFSHS
eukprot:1644201-Pyramimonas_sp.AAC.1